MGDPKTEQLGLEGLDRIRDKRVFLYRDLGLTFQLTGNIFCDLSFMRVGFYKQVIVGKGL